MGMAISEVERKLRHLKSLVRGDCKRIQDAERLIDDLLNGHPLMPGWGKHLAQILNEITAARQSMQHFGLNMPFSKIK